MTDEKKRTLVLCVDHDNDVGVKAGVQTPILGKENNLKAATELVLFDPEESDANAIFGAIRIYESQNRDADDREYQLATIVGSELGGVRADREVRNQLLKVLDQYPSEDVILVTDGFSDEAVLPIIQSHVKILSIQRIVVKHSQRIEESWAVFWRYMARLVNDPYYSRWALGAPGILLIALATLLLYASQYVGIVVLVFAGSLFVIRGFGVDRKIGEWVIPSPPNLIRLFTAISAMVIIGVDIYQTYTSLVNPEIIGDPSIWLTRIPEVIGWALKFGIDLIIVASGTSLVGMAIYFFFTRDPRIWWTVVGLVVTLWTREMAFQVSDILLIEPPIPLSSLIPVNLIITIGLGILTTVITIFVTRKVSKRFEHYFNNAREEL
jgi:putative membrane protein